MIEGAGVPLAAAASGSGPDVVLVHDLASGAAPLDPLREALVADGHRVVVYDRRGYGGSGAPEAYRATTIHEQAEDAAAVLRALTDGPATVVGLGFGALTVLDVLVRHATLARAAVLVDPPAFAFVPEANEALAAERLALEEALRASGPGGAHAVFGGTAAEYPRAALADYAGRASWSPSRRELRAIAVPVAIVATPGAPAHVALATQRLADHLPTARSADGVRSAVRPLAG